MEISKKIDAAIKAKTTKLKELIEAYKVDISNSKRDRTARVKTSIPPKEGDKGVQSLDLLQVKSSTDESIELSPIAKQVWFDPNKRLHLTIERSIEECLDLLVSIIGLKLADVQEDVMDQEAETDGHSRNIHWSYFCCKTFMHEQRR